MQRPAGHASRTPVVATGDVATFIAADDDAALAYVREHHFEQISKCERAELSSMRIVSDAQAPNGFRLVDDSHQNPHFQDTYVRFNPVMKTLEIDFESTRTALIADAAVLRR